MAADASPFDWTIPRYLRSVPAGRLYVGDDLPRAHWPGLDETFGPLLAGLDESVLAVHDASTLGRGRLGFVVTDRHLVYVEKKAQGVVALAHVRKVWSVPDGVRLEVRADEGRTQQVTLPVGNEDALVAVTTWLHAVAALNAGTGGEHGLPAAQALARLETLVEQDRLTPDQQARLRRLVRRLDARSPPRRDA